MPSLPTPPSSAEIPARAASADDGSGAIEDAVGRFARLLRGAGARHGLSPDEIDEATQEVRLRLWRALHDGETIARAPASYVYRTVTTAILDLVRRRRRRRETPTDLQAVPGLAGAAAERADGALASSELAAVLESAIGDLVESRRAVVRMYLTGYGREEIADLMGWTEARTRNLLYRGLAELRVALRARGVSPEAGA